MVFVGNGTQAVPYDFYGSAILTVGDDAHIVPLQELPRLSVLHTVCRFAVRVDVGIDPYGGLWQ